METVDKGRQFTHSRNIETNSHRSSVRSRSRETTRKVGKWPKREHIDSRWDDGKKEDTTRLIQDASGTCHEDFPSSIDHSMIHAPLTPIGSILLEGSQAHNSDPPTDDR